jgi:hypothetical protein
MGKYLNISAIFNINTMDYPNKYDFHQLKHKKAACEECAMFEKFGQSCWFFWEHKKECSQKEL